MADWILVDRRSPLVRAWSRAFVNTDVHVAQADLVTAAVGSAWVSPANSFGWMDGGVNWVIARAYAESGCDITRLVQTAIRDYAAGELPVGQALVIPTPDTPYTHLIVAPTMRTPRPAFWTVNAYLAFRAALLAAAAWNATHTANAFQQAYCPGLATGVGRMPARRCAQQMRVAWDQVMQPPNTVPSLGQLTTHEQVLRYR